MSKYLDLDDVAAQSPLAMTELAALRGMVEADGWPDCRTCANYGVLPPRCFSVVACNGGSSHKLSRPVYLWPRITEI